MSKTAFDQFKRDSVYSADPMQLCIQGGTLIPTADERSDLDTEPAPDMVAPDRLRLSTPLKPGFRKNIARRGVNTPIIIVKIGDLPVVVEGKCRVRAARAANRALDEAGETTFLKVRCVMQFDKSKAAVVRTMISANNNRTDDSFLDILEKLKILKDTGADDDDCALEFGVEVPTIKAWINFEMLATDETKAAVKAGQLTPSSAAEVARIKDPDEQREKLKLFLTAPNQSVKAARQLRGAKGANSRFSKRALAATLRTVQEMDHKRHGDKTMEFWNGVENAILWILGDSDATLDERIKALE